MKGAVSFLVSIALHAGALAVPFWSDEAMRENTVAVSVRLLDARIGEPSSNPRPVPRTGRRTTRGFGNLEAQEHGIEGTPVSELPLEVLHTTLATQDSDETKVGADPQTDGASHPGQILITGRGGDLGEIGSAGDSGRGIGLGQNGSGNGGHAGLAYAQADYAHNPRPLYPERAQREGWEGTVLLRVLINHQGKAVDIELSQSSGFETLDRAAMKTVKDWRFHPARRGEKAVESWVKIPIVFKLTDRGRGS